MSSRRKDDVEPTQADSVPLSSEGNGPTAPYPEEPPQEGRDRQMAYQQPGYNPQFQQSGYPPYQGQYGSQPPPPPGWQAPPPQHSYMPAAGDPHMAEQGEGPFKYAFSFNERTIRQAFIRKVFTLVTIMLGVVAIMTAIPFIHKDLKTYARQNTWLYFTSYITFFVTYIVLVCCEGVRRSFPANLIITGIFTLATGYMTMMLTMQFTTESVLLALIVCTLSCGSIIIFATQTKYDLTNCMGVLAVLGLFLFLFGLVAMIGVFAFHVRWLHTIYAFFGALLFMAYLAVDVQLLMGGKKYEISPEDHIFAAIQLFLDIIYIFWFLLSLFGSRD